MDNSKSKGFWPSYLQKTLSVGSPESILLDFIFNEVNLSSSIDHLLPALLLIPLCYPHKISLLVLSVPLGSSKITLTMVARHQSGDYSHTKRRGSPVWW